jgi:hypothetical protein
MRYAPASFSPDLSWGVGGLRRPVVRRVSGPSVLRTQALWTPVPRMASAATGACGCRPIPAATPAGIMLSIASGAPVAVKISQPTGAECRTLSGSAAPASAVHRIRCAGYTCDPPLTLETSAEVAVLTAMTSQRPGPTRARLTLHTPVDGTFPAKALWRLGRLRRG